MPDLLPCWRCGVDLSGLPSPFGRRDECPDCRVDLHVCQFCVFYDTSVAKHCREPIAEEVKDKERANFCDYFSVHAGRYAVVDHGPQASSRAQLESFFGLDAGTSAPTAAIDVAAQVEARRARESAARAQLEDLFGLGKKQDPDT